MKWKDFYEWLHKHGYDIVRQFNIFRGSKYITYFDSQEDWDSGEIEETIERIKQNDSIFWHNKT